MTPHREDYLKVLLRLSSEEGIRSSDIAKAMGITKASVSCMMLRLSGDGYVEKVKYGRVTLTEKGREAALRLHERYAVLRNFFHRVLGVDAETAARDACSVEHLISGESMAQITRQLEPAATGVRAAAQPEQAK